MGVLFLIHAVNKYFSTREQKQIAERKKRLNDELLIENERKKRTERFAEQRRLWELAKAKKKTEQLVADEQKKKEKEEKQKTKPVKQDENFDEGSSEKDNDFIKLVTLNRELIELLFGDKTPNWAVLLDEYINRLGEEYTRKKYNTIRNIFSLATNIFVKTSFDETLGINASEKESIKEVQEKFEEEEKVQQSDTASRKAVQKNKNKQSLQLKWKPNWEDFKEILNNENITSVYHFTDRQNLDSIEKNGGLYSWKACENKNISIINPGGSSTSRRLDSYHGLENYVRLSFTMNHPMMYVARNDDRIPNPVVLEIDLEVIYWASTRFSNMNATKNGHKEGVTIKDFERIKFDVVKQPTHFDLLDEDKPFYQAEVMVETFIPIKYIKQAYLI